MPISAHYPPSLFSGTISLSSAGVGDGPPFIDLFLIYCPSIPYLFPTPLSILQAFSLVTPLLGMFQNSQSHLFREAFVNPSKGGTDFSSLSQQQLIKSPFRGCPGNSNYPLPRPLVSGAIIYHPLGPVHSCPHAF